jgi:hypothetical protein
MGVTFMLKQLAVATSLVLLLLPVAVHAESFTSDKYGFSADFPVSPTVSEPKGSEIDNEGNFIATMVMFSAHEPGTTSALVTVDSYAVSKKLNIAATLKAMRNDFIRGMEAKIVSSDPGTRDGHQALFFTYDTRDHSAAGSGIVIIISRKKPRTYLVVNMHTPAASAEQIVAADAFLASFHIK